MFRINDIKLVQFRNYPAADFTFSDRIISICGLNGKGKTNLLDAVYSLCFTKSYFGKADILSVSHGFAGFNLNGNFNKEDRTVPVSLTLRETGKKELWVDNEQISPFSLHIGKFPVVFIAPDDIELITGASEERRKLIDTILAQMDPDYLKTLIRYTKTLQERNRYLKQASNGGQIDETLLDAFDDQLIQSGSTILGKRSIFLKEFIPLALNLYAFISDEKESPEIQFIASAEIETYKEKMQRARQKDIILQRTSIGIHKDELDFRLNDSAFKQIASQGQKKSLLFALKLAEFMTLKMHFGFEPILLLDDIFEKLDQNRLNKLLEWVCIKNQGQVILTDTHEERVQKSLQDISVSFQIITL